MKLLKLFFLIFFTGAYFCSGEWVRVDSFTYQPSYLDFPIRYNYVSLRCSDSMNCAAIANWGGTRYENVFCRSTNDGGKTWKLTLLDTCDYYGGVNHYSPAEARYFVYPDRRLALILCDSGYYYVSRDSCNTWEKNKLPTNDVLYVNNFLNAGLGIIGTYRELFITRDSARSFERINIYDSITHLSNNNVVIVDTNVIYLVSSGPYPIFHRYLFKSTDFGKTFVQLWDKEVIICDIYFWNRNKGIMVGRGKYLSHLILMTSNGGLSWSTIMDSVTAPANGIRDIIINGNNGFCLGLESILWRSTDTCKTWYKDLTFTWPGLDVPASSIAFRTKDKVLGTSLGEGTIWEQDYSKPDGVFEHSIPYESRLIISPNPATDYIEITSPSINHTLKGVVEGVQIYNVFGEGVWKVLPSGEDLGGVIRMDVSSLPPGVYFVRVGEKVGKFVKM